jgi:hypothetical protein
MALPWESAKKLMRLQGMSEELLASARAADDSTADSSIRAALESLAREIQVVLETTDPTLAAEFERLIVGTSGDPPLAAVQGAVIAGWLRAALGAEALDEKRAAAAPPAEPRSRKHRIRSPVTRAATPEEQN